MGFTPSWINIDKAIEQNKKILEKKDCPRWTKRETKVLEYIKTN